MNIAPVPVTMIAGPYRRTGWRATLHDQGVTVWRCQCDRPHVSKDAADACGLSALRARLGRRGMRVWAATYRPKQQFTPEEIERMDDERGLMLLDIQTHPNLPTWGNPEAIPAKAEAARAAIVEFERVVLESPDFSDVQRAMHALDVIKAMFKNVRDVRWQAEDSIMCGTWRIAREFVAAQEDGLVAQEGRPWDNRSNSERLNIPTITQLFEGRGRTYAHRLRTIEPLGLADIRQKCADLHRAGKDATLNAVYEQIRADETRLRRAASLYAEPFPDGMEYRIGDCREMFADIEDESVAAIITDPPYGTDAEPLYEWLAAFSARVLMPGGSLICYSGNGRLPYLHDIFRKHLNYWWTPILLHDAAQKMLGAGVRAGYKPILWYVKDGFRQTIHERRTLVPDVLNHQVDDDEAETRRAASARDKSDHLWSQGDAGVRVWVHHLARQGDRIGDVWVRQPDLIIDPFAGRGAWGRIAADMGRRWLGCDIAAGGTESIMADELEVADAAD